MYLRVIAHTTQQADGDARRPATAHRQLAQPVSVNADTEQCSITFQNECDFLRRVEFQTLNHAKTISKRRGQQSGARRRSDQRKPRQIEADRAGGRTFADHDVEGVILHRGVENFFNRSI